MSTDFFFEPLEAYETEFKPNFAKAVREKFDSLLAESKVDAAENKKLVDEIRKLQSEHTGLKRKKAFLVVLTILLAVAAVVGGFMLFGGYYDDGKIITLISIGVVAAVLLAIYLIVICVRLQKQINALAEAIEKQIAAAYEQMRPLNSLFTWRTIEELIEQVIPDTVFDRVFSVARHQDMIKNFDFPGDFADTVGVCQCVTGTFRKNPFALLNVREMEWGEKTYEGSLTISWEEEETDSDGNEKTVTHYQTLTATVTKPYPEYSEYKMLYYGHETAPELTFFRSPSDLSGKSKGFFSDFSKKRELNKLKKKARKMDEDNKFTLMSNHDFEVLFHADNRNDEHEFRVLFTPLAQAQMVKVLNDKKVGRGDNFCFRKTCRTNAVIPEHLQNVSVDTDPGQFVFYDLEESRNFFISRNEEFFDAFYFAFTPLWTIPAYHEPRQEGAEEESPRQGNLVSPWAGEMLAYAYGEEYFRHKDSVTMNILKTQLTSIDENGISRMDVSAHGYRVEERIDYVTKWGNDGNYHEVPVHWDEYLPVCKVRPIHVLKPDFDNAGPENEWEALQAARRLGAQDQDLRYYKNWITYL